MAQKGAVILDPMSTAAAPSRPESTFGDIEGKLTLGGRAALHFSLCFEGHMKIGQTRLLSLSSFLISQSASTMSAQSGRTRSTSSVRGSFSTKKIFNVYGRRIGKSFRTGFFSRGA